MRLLGVLRDLCAVTALAFLALLLLSGFGLMASYVPSEREAFDSVLYLRKQGGVLALLRDLHAHLASGLVVAGALYLAAVYVRGDALSRPRGWWAALALFGLVLFACFTGFLLPMDQEAYWGTIVRLGIIETIPLVGGPVADLLRGGASVNAATLTRFYALHAAVLPWLMLVPLSLLGRWAVAALGADSTRARRLLRLGLIVVVAAYSLATFWPARLEPRAAPGDTEYVPRPEWYFLWLFQLGKYAEGLPWLRSLVLPAVLAGGLAAVPFASRQTPRSRALLAGAALLAFLGLGGLARFEDRSLPPKPTYEQALAVRAEHLYKEECASCHGTGGKGDGSQARTFALKTPDFTNAEFWKDATEDTMRDAVRNGKGEDMPAFGKKLGLEDVDALLQLVRTRFQPSK